MTVTPDIVAKQTYYPLPMEEVDPRAEDTHDNPIAAEEGSIPYVNSFGAGVLQRLIRSGAVPPDGLLKEGREHFRISVPSPEKVLNNPVFPSQSKNSDAYAIPFQKFLKAFHASLAQFGDVDEVVMIGSGVAYAVGPDALLSVLPEACRAPFKQFPDLFQSKIPSDFDFRIMINKKADSKVLSPEHLKLAAEKIFHSFYLRMLRFELAFKIKMHHKSFQEYTYDELLNLLSAYDTPEKLESLRIMHPDGRNINCVRQKVLCKFLKNCTSCGHDPLRCEPFLTKLIFSKLPVGTVPTLQFTKCESLAKISDNQTTLEGASITLEGDIPVDISCIVLDRNENERFEHQRLGLAFRGLEKEISFELYGCLQAPFDLAFRTFNWTKVKCDHNDWLAYIALQSQGVPSPRDREWPRLMGISNTHFENASGLKNAIETFNKIKGQSNSYKAICLLNAALARGLTPEEQSLFFKGYEELEGVLGKVVGVVAGGELSLTAAAAILQFAACRILLLQDPEVGNQPFRVGLQTHARVPVVVYAFPEGTLMIPLNLSASINALQDLPQGAMEPLLDAVGGIATGPFNPESPLKQDAALLRDFLSVPLGPMDGPEPSLMLFTQLMQHSLYPSQDSFMGLIRNHGHFVEKRIITHHTLGQLLNAHLLFFAESDRQKLAALLPVVFSPEAFDRQAYIPGLIALIDQQLFDEGLRLLELNPAVLTPQQKWQCIQGLLGQGRLLRVLKIMQIAKECNEGAPHEWRAALETIVTVIVGMRGQERERKLSLCRKAGDLLLWAMQTFQGKYDFVERFEEFANLCEESCYADLQESFQPYVAEKKQDLHRQNMLRTIDSADRRDILQSVESMLQFAGSFHDEVRDACLSFLRKCYLDDTQHSLEVLLTLMAMPQFSELFTSNQKPLGELLDRVSSRYKNKPHLFTEILRLMEFSNDFSPALLEHMLREGTKRLESNPGKEPLNQAKQLLSRCKAAEGGRPYLYLHLLLNLLDQTVDPQPLIIALDALEILWRQDSDSPATLQQVRHLMARLFPHRAQQMFDRALAWIESHPQACSDEDIWKYAEGLINHKRWLRAANIYKVLHHRGSGTISQWQNLLNNLMDAIIAYASNDPERKKLLVSEIGSLVLETMRRFGTSLHYLREIETLRTLCREYGFQKVTEGFDAMAAVDQSKAEEEQMAKDFASIPSDHPLPALKAIVKDKTHLPESSRALLFSFLRKIPVNDLLDLIFAIHAAPEFSGLLSNAEFKSDLVNFLDQMLQKRHLLSGSLTTTERFFSLPYEFSTAAKQHFLTTLASRMESEPKPEELDLTARVLNKKGNFNESIELQEAVHYLAFLYALNQASPDPAPIQSSVQELIQIWKQFHKRNGILPHIKTCFEFVSGPRLAEFFATLMLLDEYITTLPKKQQNRCQPLLSMLGVASSLLESQEAAVVLKGGDLFKRSFDRGASEGEDLEKWMDCLTRFLHKSEQMPAQLMPIFSQIHTNALKMMQKENAASFFQLMTDEIVENDDKDMVIAFVADICNNMVIDGKMHSTMRTFYGNHMLRLFRCAMDEKVNLTNLMVLRDCISNLTKTNFFSKEEIKKLMGDCTKLMWRNMFSPDSFLMQQMNKILEILKEAFVSNSIFTTDTPISPASAQPQLEGDRLMFYKNIQQIVEHLENHVLDDVFTPDSFLKMVIAHAFRLLEVIPADKNRTLPQSDTYLADLFAKIEPYMLEVREAYQHFQIHSKPIRQTLPPVLMEFLIFVFRNFKPKNAAGDVVMAGFGAAITKRLIDLGFEIADLMNLQIYRTPPEVKDDVLEAFTASFVSRSLLLFLKNIETLPIETYLKRGLELEYRILTMPYHGLPEDKEDVALETLDAMYKKMCAPGALPPYSFIRSFNKAVVHYGSKHPFKQLKWFYLSFSTQNFTKIPLTEFIINLGHVMEALRKGLKIAKYPAKEKMEWTAIVVEVVSATINSLENEPNLSLELHINFLDLLEELSKPQTFKVEERTQRLYPVVLFGIKTQFQATFHQFISRLETLKDSLDLRFDALHEYYLTLSSQINMVSETEQVELKEGLLEKAFILFDMLLKEIPHLSGIGLAVFQKTAMKLLIASKTIVDQNAVFDFSSRQAVLIPFLGSLLNKEDENPKLIREMLFLCFALPASEIADDPANQVLENFFIFMNVYHECSPTNAEKFARYVASELPECKAIVQDPRFVDIHGPLQYVMF